jgi:hypothetical protein
VPRHFPKAGDDAARLGIELGLRIADLTDHVSRYGWKINGHGRVETRCNKDDGSRYGTLGHDARKPVTPEDMVHKGIAHLIAKLVGMAFSPRF